MIVWLGELEPKEKCECTRPAKTTDFDNACSIGMNAEDEESSAFSWMTGRQSARATGSLQASFEPLPLDCCWL
jgi:hypothetical protein